MTFRLQEPEAPFNNATSRVLRRDPPAGAGGLQVAGLKYQKDKKFQPPALDSRYTRKYIKPDLLDINLKKLSIGKHGRSHNKNI
jgi:hypothetical protein